MIDRDRRSVSSEIRLGFIPKEGRRGDKLNLIDAIRGHCAYLESQIVDAKRRSTSAGSSVQEARAKEIEQRIAQRDKKLIATDEAFAVVDLVLARYRTALDGMPARFTRDLAERRRLEDMLSNARTDAVNQLEQSIASIRAGGSPDEAAPQAATGRVGRKKSPVSSKRRNSRPARPASDALHGSGRAGGGERKISPGGGHNGRPERKN